MELSGVLMGWSLGVDRSVIASVVGLAVLESLMVGSCGCDVSG
jgi:hypothetical protein